MRFLRIAATNIAVFSVVISALLGGNLLALGVAAALSAFGILVGGAVYWGAKRVLRLPAGKMRLVSALVACAVAIAYPLYEFILWLPAPGVGDGQAMGAFMSMCSLIAVGAFALAFGAGVGQDAVQH